MSKIILHIGTHKTATTTIQNTFAANRAVLARHGLDYPELGRVPGHHGLVMKWLYLPEVYALTGGPEAAWARIGAMARAGRTVFLSSEEFSRGLPQPRVDFRELRRYLEPFAELQVVCTLRDQLSYLQSIYLEVSKKAVPPPWANFLAGALASGFGAGLFLDFGALDDHLRTGFARDEIRYVDFTAARSAPGGVLSAFLELAGTGLRPEALRPVDGGQANVSPDPLAAWAANQIALPQPASAKLLRLVEGALAEERGEGMRTTLYTRAEEARVLAHFAPLNARFSERIAAHTPGFCVTAPACAGRKLYREDLGPGFWLRIARRLHADKTRRVRAPAPA
jgi:hypothetical protein